MTQFVTQRLTILDLDDIAVVYHQHDEEGSYLVTFKSGDRSLIITGAECEELRQRFAALGRESPLLNNGHRQR